METSTSLSHVPIQKYQNQLSWSVLIILLLLRVVLFGWIPVIVEGPLSWIDPVFQIATYAFTAVFLYLNRDQLSAFNIDRLAIFFVVLFKPLQTLIMPLMGESLSSNPMAFPNIPAILIWVIAILMLVVLWPSLKTMPKIHSSKWGWLIIGAVAGILLVFIVSFLLLPFTTVRKITPIYDITMLLAYPYQMGYAGVDEEPLFRGLLWGQLRKSGWRVGYVILTQALIFMLAHGRLLTTISDLPFALTILLGGVVFGLLVMRSRSISTSITAHGFYNASSIFAYYLISNLFG